MHRDGVPLTHLLEKETLHWGEQEEPKGPK